MGGLRAILFYIRKDYYFMTRTAEIILEFQPYIMQCPVTPEQAHKEACVADDTTINHWRETWIKNIKANHKKFGSFAKHSVGKLYGSAQGSPCIIAGSGPSLKHVGEKLKDRPKDMLLISCLHNFHYMEDHGAKVDYYVTLDAGPITIKEVTEGGTKSEDEYWKITKDRILIAYIGTDPKLLEKWQGKVYFYNAPVPDPEFLKEVQAIEQFNLFIESGGCVLGTATFLAKGFLGSQVTVFVGSDFSFSNEAKRRFHAWDSSYDANIGKYINCVDIFGNRAVTWRSYYNFKQWFEVVAQRVPGIYINATEGGILGAHRDGNIIHIKQMWLDDVFKMFGLSDHKKGQATKPEICDNVVFI